MFQSLLECDRAFSGNARLVVPISLDDHDDDGALARGPDNDVSQCSTKMQVLTARIR